MTALVRDPIPLPARPGGRPPAAGAASLALRPLLDPPRRPARVIAVFPSALYLEMRGGPEPRVLAVVTSDAHRLPNAVVLVATRREHPFRAVREGGDALVGDGRVEADGLRVRVRRWWDPSPALGTLQPAALAAGVRSLEAALEAALDGAGMAGGGLAGHPDPVDLAAACAAGDLAGAVEAAERIVGLGPGLTPSGDDILCGLLVSLRLVGGAVRHGRPVPLHDAVRLADWLGAAVTADAGTRTTALAATLLHCATAGGAGAEVAAVLRCVAGHEPPDTAVRRLLAVGHTSGTDLAQGVLAGCRAVLTLTAHASRAGRPTPRVSA
ncbi:DUF2877 domain-containing protein [Actinomadura livida]|uniref:DUF2877 domain-containing protein n=1 Tax=Actinomadura livida TaxID=79909 RepID=A0A7W7MZY8_9ACTN|nr:MULTISPECIES: DUF2877 domain-containing protein [Actinomadura]MBB4776407.1 hypothetical protein [Actinomadura catellatispora]GGT92163.1 hypothetical protein GCM10010208_13700 [Actinomadura livida]